MPDGNKAFFAVTWGRVCEYRAAVEQRSCVDQIQAVLGQIQGTFFLVPFKVHRVLVSTSMYIVGKLKQSSGWNRKRGWRIWRDAEWTKYGLEPWLLPAFGGPIEDSEKISAGWASGPFGGRADCFGSDCSRRYD
jgi:hypothetical protein